MLKNCVILDIHQVNLHLKTNMCVILDIPLCIVNDMKRNGKAVIVD